MDSAITLWQFLLQLLQEPHHKQLICWTSNDGEFKLLKAEEVARLWGVRKNRPSMNYDKLSRALRYYYVKNIIKKVNGQKFVYKFASYPDILTMDPLAVLRGDEEAEGNTADAANTSLVRDQENCNKERVQCPPAKSSGRNDYINSGLYTSFTLDSLNTAGVKLFRPASVGNTAEKKVTSEPPPSVIKFVTTPTRYLEPVPVLPSALPHNQEVRDKSVEPCRNITSNSPPRSSTCFSPIPVPSETSSPTLNSDRDVIIDTDLPSVTSKYLDFSSDVTIDVQVPKPKEPRPEPGNELEYESESERYVLDKIGKSKKPKELELTPTLVITTSDSNPLGILSPSLPTASLTPFFSQTPILLTPNAMLSSIHFWSTLSPVAPLSPARLHGNTLFQFPSVYNSHGPLTLSSFDSPSTPGPFTSDMQKS